MTHQLTFAGFGPGPDRKDKLLYALYPAESARELTFAAAKKLQTDNGVAGNRRPKEILHITLCEVGNFAGLPANIVERAKETGARIKAQPFEIILDRAVSFRGNGAYVLRVSESHTALQTLRQDLFTALKIHGPGCQGGSGFTPHVTLMYGDHLVPEHPIEPIVWQVREFVLVHSPYGDSEHIPLARWPLIG